MQRQAFQGLQGLLDLLFPPQCVCCQRHGSILCTPCLTTLYPPSLPPPGEHGAVLNAVYHLNVYQGTLRTCIHAFKYRGQTRLAEPLGLLLAQLCLSYHLAADLLVPVPLHPERHRQRGYNHAELLARVCSRYSAVPLATDLLIRTRATPAQVGLSAYERQRNMAHAFQVSATQAIYGRRITIIDDVCTTGATLEACAITLLRAGAYSVSALVLARPS